MPRINSVADLGELNKQLLRIDDLQKQLNAAQQQIASVHNRVTQIETAHVPATLNTVVFTWTGATHTLSWTAGSVVDKRNINVPVKAGSKVLLASTYYWLAWNPTHQVMAAQPGVSGLLQTPDNIVICQVFTGTAGQTGTAGGGGSSATGGDLSGGRYKLL